MPTLLAVIPHPDDESYSFGGTLALAAKAGWRCVVICASSGERGKRHDGGPPGEAALAAAREAELAASCRLLGAEPPIFWRLPDGGLRAMEPPLALVRAAFETYSPGLILTLGEDGAYGHPDHIAVHGGVRDAWRAPGPHRPPLLFAVFPRGAFLPQYEKCIDMMGDPPSPPPGAIGAEPWHYEVDVSSILPLKLAAVSAHRTQLPGGDPHALFPPGVLTAVLTTERFADASGEQSPAAARLLASFGG